ncbi:nuclear transport factor 2 family protein [Rhodococcus sp. (in: high G+C Gram-positive bacteria)]|jgi:predicted SnoaL-like aldol condensation-catalyzing enzyme|uniref:nuclear transport factor 2 family protein n=1 Tax=Rhodococcus sp. TaxID=1831 RepID=UPI00257BF721|nr:nuclear transport factor 2 family protein [Rhodococcus sp. (in: high G+C Gram-positive bacteria)]MBQ7806091.1 nuclear transport factor 2 family protein [Rhodococcus sp. (in: high G+C Gram-positive bacteria)]
MTDTEKNKRLVERLFEVIYGQGDNLHIFDEVVAEDYIQHNPIAEQGRAGLRDLFTKAIPLPLPDELSKDGTQHVNLIAEGDLVVRHELRTNGMLVDIYRVENGLLQEHWDAFRPAEGYECPF